MPVPGMKNAPGFGVIQGVGNIYIADIGTSWPTVDGTAEDEVAGETIALPAGWTLLSRATDGGWKFSYKENNSPVRIDQQRDPLFYVPDTAESFVEIALADMDHANLLKLVSNASQVTTAAAVGVAAQSNIYLGGSTINEFQILIEGLSAVNPAGSAWWELIFIWRAMPTTELAKTYRKLEKQMISGRWDVVADGTRTEGRQIARIVHQTSLGSS